jgi:hypothetical protein
MSEGRAGEARERSDKTLLFRFVGLRCTDSTWQFYDFNISTTVRHNVSFIKTLTYWQH